MTRIIAKVFAVTFALAAYLNIASASAESVTFLATNGSGASCSFSQPCAVLLDALGATDSGGQISCFDSTTTNNLGTATSINVTIDCSGLMTAAGASPNPILLLNGSNQIVKIRNLTITGRAGLGTAIIKVTGSGTLILENCVFENLPGTALDIEPNGPLNLVIKNSRISNNGSGVLLKPASGGGVTAAFDGVTIADNTGGGLKTDSTNGVVSVDISNSTISKNTGNGLNAVSGGGATNVLSLKNDVIAQNGAAGIQANGAFAAVLVNNTLLDNNTIGATSAVGGGRILTYGNNSIIGPVGSNFTGTASLQ
jgi:hypothetical protein